jgi:hypothetical protein
MQAARNFGADTTTAPGDQDDLAVHGTHAYSLS